MLTPEELAALDAAIAVVQAECEYCTRGVPGLLEKMAVEMLHTGQLLAACRGLPTANTTRASKIELMTRKHEGLLYWEPLFHPRSRKICRESDVLNNSHFIKKKMENIKYLQK